jgi:hypothetical protein
VWIGLKIASVAVVGQIKRLLSNVLKEALFGLNQAVFIGVILGR